TGRQLRAAGERVAAAESGLAAAQRQVADLDANVSTLAEERERLVGEAYELRQDNDRLTAAHSRLEEDLARARAEQAATADALTQARERAGAAERAATDAAGRADEYRALLDSVGGATEADGEPVPAGHARGTGAPGATWRILLATLERRWAAAVGVPPDDRGMQASTVPDQLVEALGRESERLREEVGVDVEVRTAGPVEAADPVTLLLAATDLLGVLAAVCDRVTLELDGGLLLVGQGWSGPTDEVEVARVRAVTAGLPADEIVVDADRITVTLHPGVTATT
ncbi:MAG TPA: hypothetical protein VE575_01705, partial [Acidimicrobiales bacterium]|nr:hypothetical protein [Acidimicrobiales bacterium]